MEDYRKTLHLLLKELIGKEDVSTVDFKEIDVNTKKKDLDFKKVIASIRLSDPDYVQLPVDTEPIIERFLSLNIP